MSRTGRSRAAFALAIAIFGTALVAGAQDDSAFDVEARLEPDRGITDTQPVRLVIRISGSGAPEVAAPRLPALENLRVVNGPFTSSNFRWVNGRSSAVVTLTYTLLALAPGQATVPSIEVRVGERTYRTEPIVVTVAKGETAPPPTTPAPGRAGEPPRDSRDPRGPAAEPDVYLRARLAPGSVWTGQGVSLEVELLDAAGVTNLDWISTPTFSDFWVEDAEVRPDAEAYLDTVEGRRYRVYPLVRKVLIPTRPGTFAIEPFAVRLTVPASTGDPFRDLFRSTRPLQVVRKTDALRVEVRPLPEAGRPPGFSGAVGTFRLRHEVDRSEAAVDEAVAVRVVVEGDGFLKSAPAPELTSTPQFRVFEPKEASSTSIRGGRLESRKSWEWVVVPLSAGEVDLPEIAFPYFDPAAGAYRVARTEATRIAVRGSDGGRRGGGGALHAERRDIQYVKARFGPLRERTVPAHRTGVFHALLWAPFAVVPVLVALGRRRARLRGDRGLVRSRRAGTRARKRLALVERRGGGRDGASYHEEIARALVEYVADRFDRSASGLTYDVADGLLASRGVPENLRADYRRCLETCDFARFVPSANADARRAEVLALARDVVERLERHR